MFPSTDSLYTPFLGWKNQGPSHLVQPQKPEGVEGGGCEWESGLGLRGQIIAAGLLPCDVDEALALLSLPSSIHNFVSASFEEGTCLLPGAA